ncbi:MAG: glycosyltransferase [Chloroflexota bacterium]
MFLLLQAFLKQPDVQMVLNGLNLFWYDPFDVDLLHIHEPESFTSKKSPSDAELISLEKLLIAWKQRARIVTTIHNRYPHYNDTSNYARLYELVYSHSDGFTHRGQSSLAEFRAKYPALGARPQAIIPTGINPYYENTISKSAARQQLGLKPEDTVFLSFGTIRDFEELDQVVNGFKAVNLPNKKLIISAAGSHHLPQTELKLRKLRLRFEPNILMNFAKVPAERIQVYMNAADVTIIPRVQILNSAILQLGFTFGKVVVGPDTGVVAETLTASGNPIFTVNDYASVARALEQGVLLNQQGHGARNLDYAAQNWDWNQIGQKHVAFFKSIVNR